MRKLHRSIHTSSPDRGLEHALKMWPEVKKAVPDAEFHIAYGFQLFDLAHKDNPGAMGWKENMLKMMEHPGIVNHDRLPQPELAKLLATCGLWVYPTHFGEINCISALKAQYYGIEPVIVNYAALKETVNFGRRIEGDIYDDETKAKFQAEWIDALKNPMAEEKRKEMSKWAKQFEWSSIATQWTKEFGGVNNAKV